MLSQTPLRIIRRPEVVNQMGYKNTLLHSKIKRGLMVPPLPLSERAVGWLQHEIDAILAANVAGRSNEHIKALVGHLVDQRQNADSLSDITYKHSAM